MKKIIAVVLASVLLAGCATGPEKGHYYTDQNGQTQYEPSAEAKNADSWATAGVVGATIGVLAAVTLGIVSLTR